MDNKLLLNPDIDYRFFKYPIWTQQQSGMLLISTQDDFKTCYKYMSLPPTKRSKAVLDLAKSESLTKEQAYIKLIRRYAIKVFEEKMKLHDKINDEIKKLKQQNKKIPAPKFVKNSLDIKIKQRLTPPMIAKIINDNATSEKQKISVDTIRRRFDDGTIVNLSKSKTHRFTTIEYVQNLLALD